MEAVSFPASPIRVRAYARCAPCAQVWLEQDAQEQAGESKDTCQRRETRPVFTPLSLRGELVL